MINAIVVVIVFLAGYTLREVIQRMRDSGPKVLEWKEPFIIRRNGRTEFIGRFVCITRGLYGPTSVEARSLDAFMTKTKMTPERAKEVNDERKRQLQREAPGSR